jgi:steroid delta-isomerase-like uncharacterized protein
MSAVTELVGRIEKAFAAGDVDAFAACYAEDAVHVHPFFPAPNRGRQSIRAAEAGLFAAFDRITLEARNVVEGQGWSAIEWRVTARHCAPVPLPDGRSVPASGRTIDLPMVSVVRLDAAGDIAEEHRYLDGLAFMQAIGALG